jgi:DNA-binding Xre family transcriptional regulator
MHTPDERILRLIDVLIFQKNIQKQNDFLDEIGMKRQNISKVRSGKTHFTVGHIDIICKKYKVNANWIFGMESNVFNTPNSIEIK